jgi:2-C-methyl-D-erythritol 4-phosphate cytidylyltransferase
VAAVVLAAGEGARFGRAKYDLMLGGTRLVDRAVELVRPFCRDLIVVLPAGRAWDGVAVSAVSEGGASRTESLRTALGQLGPDVDVVVTHDCVRPLATPGHVAAAIDAVLGGADAAIAAWQPPDPVKRLRSDGSIEHLGRDELLIAQSPSAYRRSSLDRVFELLETVPIDESVGIELIGGRVVPVQGDRWSQHVVDPRDLELFDALLVATVPATMDDGAS